MKMVAIEAQIAELAAPKATRRRKPDAARTDALLARRRALEGEQRHAEICADRLPGWEQHLADAIAASENPTTDAGTRRVAAERANHLRRKVEKDRVTAGRLASVQAELAEVSRAIANG